MKLNLLKKKKKSGSFLSGSAQALGKVEIDAVGELAQALFSLALPPSVCITFIMPGGETF